MTIGELKAIVAQKLKGDNSSFEVDELSLREAILDVCRYTSPPLLTAEFDETKTDVFRKLRGNKYIKKPVIVFDDSSEVPIDEELKMAVVYFVCSYGSFKQREAYEQKAIRICELHNSNTFLNEE